MAKKRKHADLNDENRTPYKNSRPSHPDNDSEETPQAPQARIDPTYGQRGAFPGLDDPLNEDELFYGPANDGLEYLRMVRSEAKSVPNLLVAPTEAATGTKDEGLYEDCSRGYYADGAYTAAPFGTALDMRNGVDDDEDEDVDPQEAYYAALCARFAALSSLLQETPPMSIGTGMPPSCFKPRRMRNTILRALPKTALLAQIPQETVVTSLVVLEDILTVSNLRSLRGRNIGAWAWGLLARCRDLGTMQSEEVGILRSLGKKAVWLLRRIAAGEVVGDGDDGGEREAESDDEDDEEGEEEEEEKEEQEEEEEDTGSGEVDDFAATGEATGNEIPEESIDEKEAEATENENNINIAPKDSELDLDDSHIADSNDVAGSKPSPQNRQEDPLPEAQQRALATLHNLDTNTKDEQTISPIYTSQHQKATPAPPLTGEQQQNAEPSKIAESPPLDKDSIRATLDMIVTIVGEFYGQRDLLDGRLVWDETV
ncbi:hypothetical protein ACLMJK_009124 [Lecanora helva]